MHRAWLIAIALGAWRPRTRSPGRPEPEVRDHAVRHHARLAGRARRRSGRRLPRIRDAVIDLRYATADKQAGRAATKFDDFSEAAHRDHALAGQPGAEARRLEAAMAGAGWKPLATAWWHFDAPDAASYALSDEPL